METFAQTYACSNKLAETDLLYLNCNTAMKLSEISNPAGNILHLTSVGLGLWILIGQAFAGQTSA